NASLRRAELGVLEQLAFHNPGPQELPDEVDHPFVLDPSPQELRQLPVVDRVKVRGYISFNDPEILLTLSGVHQDSLDGIHRAAAGAEPVGGLTKVRLKDG